MTNRWLTLLALLWLPAGCLGGQSTGELDDGPGDEQDRCDQTRMPLAPDERSPLGFSASDVLGFVLGSHQRELTWLPTSPGMAASPAPSTTTVTIEINGTAGEIEYVNAEPREEDAAMDEAGDESCSDWVQIPVVVSLRTVDGGLDEAFETHLVAWDAEGAEFDHVIPADRIGGSISVTLEGKPRATLTQLHLEGMFRKGVVFGAASGSVEAPGDTGASTISYDVGGDLAQWGSHYPE